MVTPEGEREAAVLIDGEHIAAVLPSGELPADVPCEDLGEVALLPGLVDTHTHINEPGRTEWEGFVTGTRAAAAGGYTTIVDMPLNNLPETTNVNALEAKRVAAQGKCLVDFALWGGAVDGNQADLLPLAQAGVAGFKSFLIYPGCEGFTSIDRENLERALPHIAASGLPLLVHAEMTGPVEAATARLRAGDADWRQYRTYLASRPDEAELEAIEMLLQLCRTYRFRLHIVHVSTALALPMLAAAKRKGLPVTAETCPHYLHLTAEGIGDGATLCKCAPPIRAAANREALWAGLLDGTLDLIATDHSPCPAVMKRLEATEPGQEAGRFDQAWGGIASLSTALRVLWTECAQRGIPLTRLVRWVCAAPAELAGLDDQVGSIEPGKLANLVAFDTAASARLTPEQLFYRHPLSPYMGETLQGVVRSTWLRGQRVYENGHFAKQPRGRELERRKFIAADAILPARLQAWNELAAEEAAEAVLPCNGSHTWAAALAARRPFGTAKALFVAADEVWRALPAAGWQAAFDSHPRIGEAKAHAATGRSLAWSAGEQVQAQAQCSVETDEQAELAAGNRAYEARFGRIFLICATGKSAAEILAALQGRLRNDPHAELLEAAEQQRRITQLRLRKWLELPTTGCEDV